MWSSSRGAFIRSTVLFAWAYSVFSDRSHTGEHRLCFGNKMSTWTEKVVDVHISANTKHSDLPRMSAVLASQWQ
jgi:hypothetical protein